MVERDDQEMAEEHQPPPGHILYHKPSLAEKILVKTTCCECGSWRERLLIAIVMTGTGVILLLGLYHWGWMDRGLLRGICAWFIITFCFAKIINFFACGGPIPTGITAFCVVPMLEI